MSTFEGEVLKQTVGVASQHKIEPEALLAVVEVESAGKSMEVDGKTPCLLFERHIFYRELKKKGAPVVAGMTGLERSAATQAVVMGLANTTWQPKTQYKDQGTSQKRLELFARAKALDVECAIRSCSWGVGQTMGFLAEELGFKNAITMFDYMVAGGVPAQVECMVREIENKKLTSKLNAHDWAGFARIYNGPGYKENNYDSKMAVAWASWKKKGLPPATAPVVVKVPPNVQPTKPVPPPKPITPTKAATGGLAAVVAAVTAFFGNIDVRWIAFIGFILVLAAITGFILWQRRQSEKPQTGMLAGVMEG